MKRRIVSLVLACFMLMSVITVNATTTSGGSGTGGVAGGGYGVLASGEIGSITWIVSGSNTAANPGELVIEGSGKIPDYTIDNPAPWSQYSENIYEIYIKEGITGIGDFAFYGCSNASIISITKTVETIGKGAFAGLVCLHSLKVESANEFYCVNNNALYSKDMKTLIFKVPANDELYILPDTVSEISPYAFYMNTVVERIVVGNQLQSIGESAFEKCSDELVVYYPGTQADWDEKVKISENNEALSSVEYESKRLTGITFSNSKIEVESGNTVMLDVIPVPSDAVVTDVIWSVDNGNIASVAPGRITGISAGVATVRAESVDGGFVAKCKVQVSAKGQLSSDVMWEVSPDLKTLTVSGNGEIPNYYGTGQAPWEQYRQNIEKIVIENGITKIGNYAFAETKCKELVLPEGLLSIGDRAFCYSSNLEKVKFPSQLVNIGEGAFESCSKLESANIPDSVTYIGQHAFNNCEKLVSVRLPVGIESIQNGTFSQCLSLKAVKIPDSVKSIGTYAFWLCANLETVVAGAGIKTVGYDAFHGMSSLENVYYNGTSASWDQISFSFENDSILNANRIYGYEPVEKIELDKSEVSMNVRDTESLSAVFTPENASMPYVMWSSSDESVATVDANGNVTANSKGTATITATAIGENVSASCSVTTENVPANGMVIEEASVDMIKDRQYQLTLIFSPENATNRNVYWTSSNEDVVEVVGNGTLVAKGEGTAVVTGVSEDGEYTDSVNVTVIETIAEGVLDGGISWEINYQGQLIVKGKGDMPGFYPGEDDNSTQSGTAAGSTGDKDDSSWSETLAPWYEYNGEIKMVIVEDGITSIGDYAFAYCYNLENVHIGYGVTDIGKSAFESSSATGVYLPETIVSIGDNAFAYNHRLAGIYLPQNLKTIGKYAFTNCRGITGIAFPTSLESIGECAFMDSGLTYISIPENIKTIGEGAFARLFSLSDFFVEDGNSEFRVDNRILYSKDMTRLLSCPPYAISGSFEVPYGVERIDSYAFSNCYSLNSINLPETLTTIGDEAFSNCSSLNSIYIPNSVESIGKRAFSSCGFNYFSVPSGITQISEGMLSGCWSLNDVYMHNGITKIDSNAFSGSPLSGVFNFPKSLKEIGANAFSSCQISGDVKLPDGLEKIGERAFLHCQNINQIYIPSSVVSIGEAAFVCQNLSAVNVDEENSAYVEVDGALYNKDKTSLLLYPRWKRGTLVVPDGVKRIESYAFYRSNLSCVILPDGLTYIGQDAFTECPELVRIRIPDSVTSIGMSAFSNNALLKSVGLPDGITEIPGNAFSNCTMLESVTFGKNVKTVRWGAFNCCNNLREVKINSALERIESGAFNEAKNLETIFYEGSAEEWATVTKEGNNDVLNTAELIADAEYAYEVSIDTKNANLAVGDTLQLNAGVLPETIEETLVWRSSDDGIVTVENGLVTAHRAGNATIIVTTADESCIDYCKISVSTEGSIGETIKWSFADGVLTVSGTGEIPDYDESEAGVSIEKPWDEYRDIIKSIVIEEGITAIGNNAFRDNHEVESITIPETVQTIGDRSFALCERVKKLNIPKNVSFIGDEAFEGMWELESFSVDTENEHFYSQNGVLFDTENNELLAYPMSRKDTTYRIPEGIKSISSGALRDNRYLEALIMPEGLTSIGDYAFNCIPNLRKVIIPESVEVVGRGVFMGTPIGTIVYGGDDEAYEELLSKTEDNMGLNLPVHVVYNSTMPVNGVMSEPIIENGKLRVHVWTEAVFEEYRLIIALYDDENRLVKVSSQDVTDETATAVGGEFTADVDGEALGYTVKAFFWDTSDSIRILGKSLEFYVSPTIDVDTVLESPHPYVNGETVTQIYESEIGTKIEVTFDELTETEEDADFIHIYDENDNRIGKYSGTELAGKTVEIPGRRVLIKLISDDYISGYGFKTSKIVVYK